MVRVMKTLTCNWTVCYKVEYEQQYSNKKNKIKILFGCLKRKKNWVLLLKLQQLNESRAGPGKKRKK